MRSLLGNRLHLSLLGLGVTTLVCVAYLFSVVLKTPITSDLPEVTVRLTATGGLYEGSAASYRGVRIGTVRDIRVAPTGGVEALVELRDGVLVPADSHAEVRSLSPVGEQFLDFQPDDVSGPYLADGDVISAESTDLPVSVAAAADELDRVLGAVDADDLETVLDEMAVAMAGSGDDVRELVRSFDLLATDLDAAWPETERLLRNGERVGRQFMRHRDDLAHLSRSARELGEFLRGYDPRFRRLLRTSPESLDTMRTFVGDLEAVLPPFLRAMVRLGEIGYQREPHMRATPDALRYGVQRFTSAFRDGWLHVDLNLQGQRQCTYDVERRPGTSVERRPVPPDGRCALDDDVWRGAEHAPPPLDR